MVNEVIKVFTLCEKEFSNLDSSQPVGPISRQIELSIDFLIERDMGPLIATSWGMIFHILRGKRKGRKRKGKGKKKKKEKKEREKIEFKQNKKIKKLSPPWGGNFTNLLAEALFLVT